MNYKQFLAKPLVKACASALIGGSVVAGAHSVMAATAAGVQIKNIATVTYEDAAGNVYTAQSDEAIVTVAQVYSATMGVDVDVTASAGQIVYLPYVLTNTGNGADVFDLTVANAITGLDDIDSSNITIYEDANGSGEPDSGELAISSITLPANVNNSVNLVVAVEVPATASNGDTLGITLTAQAREGGAAGVVNSVTDTTAGQGRDGLDGTNESLITVTGDAVLVVTKSSTHDVASNQITYTVNVNNTGNRIARDVVIFDGLPANTTLVSSGVSGLLTTNNDILNTSSNLDESLLNIDLNADGDTTDADEATIGLDLNTDGDSLDSSVFGVYAIDKELAPGASSSLTFTVSYDPAVLGGGYIVENAAHVSGDTDGDINVLPDVLVSSNINADTINADYGVQISDTAIGADPANNDGGDDDEESNDDQFVTQVAAGSTVQFLAEISNTGNAADIFELSVQAGNFPAGTIFSFFDENGLVQLTDSNNSGVDTGVMNAGASRIIMIKATLPANVSGIAPAPATEYQATVTATSANDPAANTSNDTMDISLGIIVEAVVDLHNSSNGLAGSNEDPLGTTPYAAITTFSGAIGNTVSIPLYIDNESGASDSYALSVGSSWNGTVLGALPAGWSVQFFEGDGNGNQTGQPITSTPLIPGGQLNVEFIAVVTIPNDNSLAISNFEIDNDGDTVIDSLDGNTDGDGDYPMFFRVESVNTGASDTKLDAIDVGANRQLSLVSPGSNQLEPGNTVNFDHTLSNVGNIAEVVELTSSNSQTNWTSTLRIDTNGDGIVDTTLSALVPGDITVQQPNGVDVVVTITDADNDGNPEFSLQPGYVIPLNATIFAPSNAPVGQINSTTIVATNVDTAADAPSASLSDQVSVVNGQVRLTKQVALDALCDGNPDAAFVTVLAVGVEPGQCAIWQVVAENQGAANANNTIIHDTVPNFSDYEVGSLRYCLSAGCPPGVVTDDAADDAGTFDAGNITFFVGNNADPVLGEGGVLIPGERATVRFGVRVQ